MQVGGGGEVYWDYRAAHLYPLQRKPQALFWLSTKALGPDGRLDPAELITPKPSPSGSTGSGEEKSNDSSANKADNEGPPLNSFSEDDSDGPSKMDNGRKSPKQQSVAVVCLPGEEELLGTGCGGPVYAGR